MEYEHLGKKVCMMDDEIDACKRVKTRYNGTRDDNSGRQGQETTSLTTTTTTTAAKRRNATKNGRQHVSTVRDDYDWWIDLIHYYAYS